MNQPIDPPAEIELYSNRPSKTGQSSPTLSTERKGVTFASWKTWITYIYVALSRKSSCYWALSDQGNRCIHRSEIGSSLVLWLVLLAKAWLKIIKNRCSNERRIQRFPFSYRDRSSSQVNGTSECELASS